MPAHMRANKTVKPGRNYRNGRAAEYAARDVLKAEGWTYVQRSAGSKGAADLVAVRHVAPWPPSECERCNELRVVALFVSVKRGTGRADKAQRERLAALPGRREIWTRIRGGFEREIIR